MKRYVGDPGTHMIRVYEYRPNGGNGGGPQISKAYLLDPRADLRNHSPTGLSWGYGGSGPAQTALALVSDVLGRSILTDKVALLLYQDVKWKLIARLPLDGELELTDREILDTIESIQKERGTHDA